MPARINVNLSDDHYAELKTLAAENGYDMSEYVRNAIRLLAQVHREKKAGQHLYLGRNNIVEKELVIP